MTTDSPSGTSMATLMEPVKGHSRSHDDEGDEDADDEDEDEGDEDSDEDEDGNAVALIWYFSIYWW